MTPDNKSDQIRFDTNTEVLKAMAHPVRIMIIDELLRNPRCFTAIHEILDVRQPNISQHLTHRGNIPGRRIINGKSSFHL